jgi:hypothetical protein
MPTSRPIALGRSRNSSESCRPVVKELKATKGHPREPEPEGLPRRGERGSKVIARAPFAGHKCLLAQRISNNFFTEGWTWSNLGIHLSGSTLNLFLFGGSLVMKAIWGL